MAQITVDYNAEATNTLKSQTVSVRQTIPANDTSGFLFNFNELSNIVGVSRVEHTYQFKSGAWSINESSNTLTLNITNTTSSVASALVNVTAVGY